MSAAFEWDEVKDIVNQQKHGVSFFEAQQAFFDKDCVIAKDQKHSHTEERFYCFGLVGDRVITIRFTYRNDVIRIIGAGYWRKGKQIYEKENSVHG